MKTSTKKPPFLALGSRQLRRPAGQLIALLLVLGGGAWAQGFRPRTDYPTGNVPYSVAAGDFNADGKPDLAVANAGGNTVTAPASLTAEAAPAPSLVCAHAKTEI